MIDRRELFIGGACFVAAGAAFGMTPRRRLSLLGGQRLQNIVPATVGRWTSSDVTDLVAPRGDGSLAARLYGDTLERNYRDNQTGSEVMMVLAHGDSQTNELQLHRPEACYPAFGFELSGSRPRSLPLVGGVDLPARQLVADAPGRRESIIYWSRIGEFLPVGDGEQRMDRLKTALSGYIADGLLARFSSLGADSAAALSRIVDFIPALIR